jgi:hypothetical protein
MNINIVIMMIIAIIKQLLFATQNIITQFTKKHAGKSLLALMVNNLNVNKLKGQSPSV